MDNGIHFISGLPRSGSTLLGALLSQNPKIHAGMSSPVGPLVQRAAGGMGSRAEFGALITDAQRTNILVGLFDGYYKGIHDAKLVIDTNRMWCSRMPLVAKLFPESRVIVCVRDLVWIMDSFERVLRKSPLTTSKMFKPQDALTAHTRVSSLASPGGTVGFAWNATQEAFYGEFADRLIVVDYEALAKEPKRTLDFIYEALGLPSFEHDFDNVTFAGGDEFDAGLGVPGLHAVARKVDFAPRQTVLPPELYERFSGRNFWRRPGANPRNVKVLLPTPSKDGPRRSAPPGMNPGPRMGMGGFMRPPAGA